MLSEELEQAKKQILSDLKQYSHMEIGLKSQKCEALRAIYKKDEDTSHMLWANLELRKALNLELRKTNLAPAEIKRLMKQYWNTFLVAARYDFHSFLIYMEKNRDAKEKFYPPRIKILRSIVQDLQDLEDGKLETYGLSMPPRTGKTQMGIFFMSWCAGRDPSSPSLATAYGDVLTRSFYDGVLELMRSDQYTYREIFPDAPIMTTNADDETIDLASRKRYKTLTCRSIYGALTGAGEAKHLAYADDLVSGLEESMNFDRLEKLWGEFNASFNSRRKEGCRLLAIGTKWSVHDPLSRIETIHDGDPRAKFTKIPALNIDGKSNFEYENGVGFSTKAFLQIKKGLDDITWRAEYMQEPIEREGVLYQEDDLMYFNGEIPEGRPDAIVAVCDSKNQGKDYVSSPCGYVYGDLVYIPDWVFNNGLPDITKPLVATMCVNNKVARIDIEMNNGGEYFSSDVDKQIHALGGHASMRIFFTSTNKIAKIVTESDYVKKHFVFLDPKLDSTPREYKEAMRNMFAFTVTGKSKHDDSVDSLSMLSQLVKDLTGMSVTIIDRRKLPF